MAMTVPDDQTCLIHLNILAGSTKSRPASNPPGSHDSMRGQVIRPVETGMFLAGLGIGGCEARGRRGQVTVRGIDATKSIRDPGPLNLRASEGPSIYSPYVRLLCTQLLPLLASGGFPYMPCVAASSSEHLVNRLSRIMHFTVLFKHMIGSFLIGWQ